MRDILGCLKSCHDGVLSGSRPAPQFVHQVADESLGALSSFTGSSPRNVMCYVVLRCLPSRKLPITMPSMSEVATAVNDVNDDTTLVESMDATADIFVCVDEAENDEPQKQARK